MNALFYPGEKGAVCTQFLQFGLIMLPNLFNMPFSLDHERDAHNVASRCAIQGNTSRLNLSLYSI